MKKSCMSSKGRAGSLEEVFEFYKIPKQPPVVHMVLAPSGVGSKGHSQASVVGEILAKGEVAVHGGVGDGIIGILGGEAGGLPMECAYCLIVVQLRSHPLAERALVLIYRDFPFEPFRSERQLRELFDPFVTAPVIVDPRVVKGVGDLVSWGENCYHSLKENGRLTHYDPECSKGKGLGLAPV